jgi:hypothetical protein
MKLASLCSFRAKIWGFYTLLEKDTIFIRTSDKNRKRLLGYKCPPAKIKERQLETTGGNYMHQNQGGVQFLKYFSGYNS